MTASAAQFRHVFRFFTVLRTVFAEFAVGLDRARTSGMSALLRLIHNAPCSQTYGSIVAQHGPAGVPEQADRQIRRRSGSGAFGSRLGAGFHFALGPQNAAPLFVFGDRHSALDADPNARARLGILGKQLFQKRHGVSRLPLIPETDLRVRRFAESLDCPESASA